MAKLLKKKKRKKQKKRISGYYIADGKIKVLYEKRT